MGAWGVASCAVAHLAWADPAARTPLTCEAAGAPQAAALADALFGQADYQHAGVCYQAAGDMAHANLAFLKAAGPQGEDTARALKAQRDAAKSLLAGVQRAFRPNH
ncbi:MAG: hypothetical protein KGJ68_08005 [Gammaproteobacteria bacterium]|nr:hypothetical protein [Gammaproteobacteria bacterium]